MRILIVFNELPFPALHGGRQDVWRQIQALRRFGVEIQLIAWVTPDECTSDINSSILNESVNLIPIVRKRSLDAIIIRLLHTLRYPSPVAARLVSPLIFKDVCSKVTKFSPDIILVENLFGWVLGRQLADVLNLPLVLRSQNIEHRYLRTLMSSAKGFKRTLAFALALVHSRKFEFNAFATSERFYDISLTDLQYWQSRGFSNGEWLPPFLDYQQYSIGSFPRYDVAFFGNLNTPNNVLGIMWFIKNVIPLLGCDISILIAGSNPSPECILSCKSREQITLLANPASGADVYLNCRCLINPVIGGSGVNMKALDMLQTALPIVSSSQGVAGLPDEIVSLFEVADTPSDFALAIERSLLQNDVCQNVRTKLMNKYFGDESVNLFINSLKGVIKTHQLSNNK